MLAIARALAIQLLPLYSFFLIFGQHRSKAMRWCSLFWHLWHAAWSVCECEIQVSCAKTDEPIEIPFGEGTDSCVPKGPCIRWGHRFPRVGAFLWGEAIVWDQIRMSGNVDAFTTVGVRRRCGFFVRLLWKFVPVFLNFDFCVSTASWACCDIVAHCLSVRQARRYRISVTNTPRKRMQYCIMLDAVISSVGGMP